jgi:hypothetical protein
MKRILENIVIYLSLALRPWALVKMARDQLAVCKELKKAIDMTMEINKTLRGELIAASRGHDGGAV